MLFYTNLSCEECREVLLNFSYDESFLRLNYRKKIGKIKTKANKYFNFHLTKFQRKFGAFSPFIVVGIFGNIIREENITKININFRHGLNYFDVIKLFIGVFLILYFQSIYEVKTYIIVLLTFILSSFVYLLSLFNSKLLKRSNLLKEEMLLKIKQNLMINE